jgi:hypothetical protein
MKIKGNVDYFDYLSYESNDDLTYYRYERNVCIFRQPLSIEYMKNICLIRDILVENLKQKVEGRVIGFCHRIYIYFWLKETNEILIDKEEISKYIRNYSPYKNKKRTAQIRKELIETLTGREGQDKTPISFLFDDIFYSNPLVFSCQLGYVDSDLIEELELDFDFLKQVNVTIDPVLMDLQFDKVISADLAYNMLYRSLVIKGRPEKEMPKISDEMNVQRHGFDPKYGFRTRPSKRKPSKKD